MFDTLIEGGTVATAADVFSADVAVKDGTIVAIGHGLGDAERTIDARGKLVLPGGIDSHVHFAQPSGEGITMADDFESGTRSALMGGNTTVLPFCVQLRGQSLREAITWYHGRAEGNCYTDVSFHLVIADPTDAVLGQELPAAVADGYTSFKVFMTYEMLKLSDREILETMDCARRTGALVMVHCENEDAIRFLVDKSIAAGAFEPVQHAKTRPLAVEREATHRAITLAEVADVPLVIVHVSNGAAMEEIARGRARGRSIVGETCTQYITLTADDLAHMDWEGAKFVCSPPPRDASEHENMWRGIESGIFDLFSSDHSPFRYDDDRGKLNPKGRKDFRFIPNGIPGVEVRLPILFSEGVMTGRIDLPRFVALTSTNHAKIYGLYPRKGTIAVGADADIAVWDPNKRVTITHDSLHDACDYTPYEGRTVTGWPQTILLRGTLAVEDGRLVGAKGAGTYLSRGLSQRTAPAARYGEATPPSA